MEHASPTNMLSLQQQQQQLREQRDPSTRADRKDKKTKKKARDDVVPADMPREFLCQLSQRPMSEPVKSVYGHTFDRPTIMKWFSQQGRVCPLTGSFFLLVN